MRGGGLGGGLASKAERTTSRRGTIRAAAGEQPKAKPDLRKAFPKVWELVRPRRWLLLFGLVLVAVNRVAGLILPISTKYLIDGVLNPKSPHPGRLLPLVGAIFAATAIQAATSFSLTQLLSKAAQRMIADLRKQVQQHIGRLSVSFYDSNRTGVLVSRIMTDVEGVRNLIGTGLVEFVGGMLTALMVFTYLLISNARMTLIVFAVIAAFVLVLQRAFKTIRPIFRERGKINAEVTGRLTESLGGVRVIKGYHAEEREATVFAGGVQRLLDNVMRSLTATSTMSFAATTVLGIVGGLVMLIGGHGVLTHRMTVGGYFQFTALLAFMIAPVFQIVNIGTQLTEALAGLDRTMEILAEKDEFSDPERVHALGPIEGNVTFDDVRFAYETDKPVLHGISFEAKPGTMTALVGSSGSGKSTIISLVCAFHKPDSGRVLIDGIDLATVRLDDYRAQLGVVLQESFLFDGTIRENVVFSYPDATEEQFLNACRIARVDEFAERFPEGYDTIVGERGVKLSGGQRQRLSIARAILANPRILILDEATSSLDSESEAMIQAGLAFLMEGRTTFTIAHRLSTIRKADQILVIEQGQIVERGTHASLYELGGRYYDLYTRQHGLETNLFLAPGEGDVVEEAK
ncbi:ABC transporter ATP-binding protein [Silvibacterium dinghuense]|uniref:ABC transporter ATP-binding protein n=1 Tax=Silvibacterium dinghuense TaxID=1560006 RepID=A0A4V1NV95_9BACT|nr:ABC transporter ATP-binding protein [Silvibacterium dinghuense]RXS94990.1 ABC transporter ATP-binding protein [Silvibacterium dinghuense]GGH09652.1 putative multidrug export ATP-binding/permease protein YgaD [Silvibacterium dinghuense]